MTLLTDTLRSLEDLITEVRKDAKETFLSKSQQDVNYISLERSIAADLEDQ